MLNTYSATEYARTFVELVSDVLELFVFTAHPNYYRGVLLLKAKGKERKDGQARWSGWKSLKNKSDS